MADDWRNLPVPSGYGRRGRGLYYQDPPSQAGFTFTEPATGDGSGTTIETIKVQIENQHPEDISALADQWLNAWYLLSDLEQDLLALSTRLAEQDWKSSAARDRFLVAGPGTTLAYLRDWMEAAMANVTALRTMVTIARDSRAEMAKLWQEYEAAIAAASETDGTFGNWFFHYNLIPGGDQTEYDDANKADAVKQVNEMKKTYNIRAQRLAEKYAGQYFDTLSTVSSGHGRPFTPMDAVMVPLGKMINFGGPGAPPGMTAPSRVGAPPRPSVSVAGPPTTMQPVPALNPASPPALNLTGAPALNPAAPPALNPPGSVVAPPVMAPLALSGAPASPPTPTPAAAPGAGGANAFRSPTVPPGLGGAGSGARQGVLGSPGRSAAPPQGMPGALRSPAARSATPPPGRGQLRTPPAGGRRGQTQDGPGGPVRAQPGTDSAFRSGTPSTSPPVLNNQRAGTPARRTRAQDPLTTTGSAGGGGAPSRGTGATPPVLNAPGAGSRPGSPAAPTGDRRAVSGRSRTGGSGPRPDSEWLGIEQARGDASAPVLGAPDTPPVGAAVSGLEEVPTALRGRAATGGAPSARRATGRPTVAAELAARHAATDPDGNTATDQLSEEGQRIVTDEEAFSVETPGGGVVAKQPQARTYQAEPPTALGG